MLRDPESGRVHFLNASAAVVWNCCDGHTSLGECERCLRNRFVVPPVVDVRADVNHVLADLANRGLLDV